MTAALVVPAPAPVTVPVAGRADRFPVHRIYCVGRNYAAHAREMGKDPDKEPPFFFLKPADAVVTDGRDVHYPPGTANYHHEVELVVAIGRAGHDIAPEAALAHVWGYAVGLDMTRRDLQLAARDLGRPWDFGKGFDESAPIGPIHPVSDIGHLAIGAITLEVNGAMRQMADLAEMIWNVPDTIAYLSRYYRLVPGDLIFTGTPAGVAAVIPGDAMRAMVTGLPALEVKVLPPLS
ncbi:MAG: fumarylacetoacetate hydrolase family protein [Burkholderiales bacterium]|nr:fumarylacetoacetate hydrolase family protein [Burkholderiales bacterium]